MRILRHKCDATPWRRNHCCNCHGRILWAVGLLLATCLGWVVPRVSGGKLPEASSTLLKMHRMYTQQPPHDMSLYNVLRVSPNATLAEIQKSYRKLTRQWHPDKQQTLEKRIDNANDAPAEQQLDRVREAYEVLKDDTTRLPYHKFGLMDTNTAAFLLTGGKSGNTIPNPDQQRLLQWMGYGPNFHANMSHRQRVLYLAANIIERLRPLVEGAISESTLADAMAQECDVLKRLPLGAQIVRCIGRAYRHSGQRVLRRHERRRKKQIFRPGADLSDAMRDKMRHAKQVWTAAVASGKLVLTEHMSQKYQDKSGENESSFPSIEYPSEEEDDSSPLGEFLTDLEDPSSQFDSQETIQEHERRKAQSAVLESLQVEALWKISKIDLDRTIQEACHLILQGDYFFFPFHSSNKKSDWNKGGDGWVGSTGELIDVNVGRLRAAAALVMVGDIMVRCSKEGTSWME